MGGGAIMISSTSPTRAADPLPNLMEQARDYQPIHDMPQDSRQRMREIRRHRFVELHAEDIADALDSDEPEEMFAELLRIRDRMKAYAVER